MQWRIHDNESATAFFVLAVFSCFLFVFFRNAFCFCGSICCEERDEVAITLLFRFDSRGILRMEIDFVVDVLVLLAMGLRFLWYFYHSEIYLNNN